MLCSTCRLNLLSRISFRPSISSQPSRCLLSQPKRTLSTSPFLSSASPTPTAEIGTDATATAAGASASKSSKSNKKVTSSVPAGALLKGLNYNKNEPDCVALNDDEYPEWLWGLLDAPKTGVQGAQADTSKMNAAQRKRHEKKLAARAASMPKEIPLHEQATDLPLPSTASTGKGKSKSKSKSKDQDKNKTKPDGVPAEDLTLATEVIKSRQQITKSARHARRKAIKQDNFLRGM